MKARLVFARALDVEADGFGHPVEGVDQLADLVLPFARQS
jgi:hypothetical protein